MAQPRTRSTSPAPNHSSSVDTGLPSALGTRSYGLWFKTGTVPTGAAAGLIAWGGSGQLRTIVLGPGAGAGNIRFDSGADTPVTGTFVCDAAWHFMVVVEDNISIDGIRRKGYLDGRIIMNSTVLNAVTLAGANRFRIGSDADGTLPYTGDIDGVFVCNYALTASDVHKLYAKGSQDHGVSPKNAGDHVERMDATSILATFTSLDAQHMVDLLVAA